MPILLIFAILTAILTYPLVFKITTYIPGFFSTDEPYSVLWESWRIKHSIINGISLRHTPLMAYPFGFGIYDMGFFTYLWTGIFYAFSLLTTPVLTYNLSLLLNFLFTGSPLFRG